MAIEQVDITADATIQVTDEITITSSANIENTDTVTITSDAYITNNVPAKRVQSRLQQTIPTPMQDDGGFQIF